MSFSTDAQDAAATVNDFGMNSMMLASFGSFTDRVITTSLRGFDCNFSIVKIVGTHGTAAFAD